MSKQSSGCLALLGLGRGVNCGNPSKTDGIIAVAHAPLFARSDYPALAVINGRAARRRNQPRSQCEN